MCQVSMADNQLVDRELYEVQCAGLKVNKCCLNTP